MTLIQLAFKAIFIVVLGALALFAVTQVMAGLREARAKANVPPSGQFYLDSEFPDTRFNPGRRVHAQVMGSGPDLIMIHGASGSLREFTFDLADRLKDRYRVILLDRPGLGYSDRPSFRFEGLLNLFSESPAQQVEMLRIATDTLEVTNPIVLGHSYGGAVALAWALGHPDDTAALVLLAGASQPWPGTLDWQYRAMNTVTGDLVIPGLVSAFAPPALLRSSVAGIFAPQAIPEGYLDHIGPELALRRSVFRANAQQVNDLKDHLTEMSKRYGDLSMPVEILHGTADEIVPLDIHSLPLSRQIPGAVLTPLEGVGHMPHHVAPEAVIAAIDRAAARAGLR